MAFIHFFILRKGDFPASMLLIYYGMFILFMASYLTLVTVNPGHCLRGDSA